MRLESTSRIVRSQSVFQFKVSFYRRAEVSYAETLCSIAGAERVNLHLSAHDPSETLFLQRLARTLGLTISSSLTKGTTTHLVVPTDEGKKYEKALEWNIKVVRADWLHAIAVTGVIPGIGGPQGEL